MLFVKGIARSDHEIQGKTGKGMIRRVTIRIDQTGWRLFGHDRGTAGTFQPIPDDRQSEQNRRDQIRRKGTLSADRIG